MSREEGWDLEDRMKELKRHREFMKSLIFLLDSGKQICYRQDVEYVAVSELIGPTSKPYPGKTLDILAFWDADSASDFIRWIELTIRFHGDVR